MTNTADTSETFVTIYQTTQRHIQEKRNLHIHQRYKVNLKV